jgi:hypothetical protein
MKMKPALAVLAAAACVILLAGPAWAHAGEEEVPAMDSFATAMALLQVQPDMTDMIGDKIGDGLESNEPQGVDLDLARQAQEAFEGGNGAEALDLLAQATGMTPAEAIAAQTDEATRPSEVPIADQLATSGSESRPSPGATAVLGFGAVLTIGLGVALVRRTQ